MMVIKNDDVRLNAIYVMKQLQAEGKTVKEIADIMCISESQVRSLKKYIDVAESKINAATEDI
jgi:DNA-directed RNA polymerase specialized sigma subunit